VVEAIRFCDKHELPLDEGGECELCRLSGMPSKPPPVRSGFLAVIIPIVLVLAGAMWLLSSYTSYPQGVPKRGVHNSSLR
jgi:hypothetical protein